MILEHRGQTPVIPDSAYIAPSATLCGAVTLGEHARFLHGAVLTAEDGDIHLGDVVVMENALIRGRARHPVRIGDAVLIGPRTHVNGATVDEEVFIATGASPTVPRSHSPRSATTPPRTLITPLDTNSASVCQVAAC